MSDPMSKPTEFEMKQLGDAAAKILEKYEAMGVDKRLVMFWGVASFELVQSGVAAELESNPLAAFKVPEASMIAARVEPHIKKVLGKG